MKIEKVAIHVEAKRVDKKKKDAVTASPKSEDKNQASA